MGKQKKGKWKRQQKKREVVSTEQHDGMEKAVSKEQPGTISNDIGYEFKPAPRKK